MRAAFGIDSPLLKWRFHTTHPTPTAGSTTLFSGVDEFATLLVRAILGISFLVLGVAMLLCQVEGSHFDRSALDRRPVLQWVRTTDGWERPDSWHLGEIKRPTLHPAVVAAGQGLLSVLGLVTFQRTSSGTGAKYDQ
jgi:hypothetical protein